jgi:hypothetical protein
MNSEKRKETFYTEKEGNRIQRKKVYIDKWILFIAIFPEPGRGGVVSPIRYCLTSGK